MILVVALLVLSTAILAAVVRVATDSTTHVVGRFVGPMDPDRSARPTDERRAVHERKQALWPSARRTAWHSPSYGEADGVPRRVVPGLYLLAGVVIAGQRGSLTELTGTARIVGAAADVVLWPLGLLGVDLTSS